MATHGRVPCIHYLVHLTSSVGEVGEGMSILAGKSVWMRRRMDGRCHELPCELLRKLRNACESERVVKFERREIVKADNSSGFSEESSASCDGHQSILKVYERTL